jgi:outer membrane protein assembly factor BamB
MLILDILPLKSGPGFNQARNFSIATFRAGLAAGALLSIAATLNVVAEDWPRWRGPNVNGISAETGWSTVWPQDGLKKLWEAKVGIGYSTVSVSKGRLYTMGNTADQDTVYCLNADTGKELWKHTYACKQKDPNGYHGTRGTPTVDGNRVYTVSREGHLFGLDADTGKVVWSKNYVTDFGAKIPTWGYAPSPLVEGDLLIAEPGAKGASVVAINKADGKIVWQTGDDPAAYSSPIAFTWNNERCLAVLHAPALAGYRLKDGKELWRYPWKTSYDVNATTPIIEGDKAFISTGYNTGCDLIQFSEQPPKGLWPKVIVDGKEKNNQNMRNHVNSCVLWQGYIYGFDDNGELRCLDFKTGEVKWKQKGYGKGSLMIAGGKFILYSDRGLVAVAEASPNGFKELSRFQALQATAPQGKDTWAAPVLANGKLYCRSLEDLVCLDVAGK